ncbi:MAG: hypothetical protein KatS3mg076_3113 [Candidatus Binatia bacterium]|nr:MAG: hypothetical protein KatS3mg076_3113 [Candidatus Binatia bacterium]
MRFGQRTRGIGLFIVLGSLLFFGGAASGYYLDEGQTMKFGVRAYVNARIGTEDTDRTKVIDPGTPFPGDEVSVLESQTFPFSAAGHLRQNRFFLEAEFDHDVTDLMKKGFGPLAILNHMPFRVRKLKYHLTYRGEADGIYDWGPKEFRTRNNDSYRDLLRDAQGRIAPPGTCVLSTCPDINGVRRTIRERLVNRHRLYQAYVDVTVGDLFLRIGRQILVWGETDVFRLLDNINPIDSSFGGFLIALDERRVPIDMIRASYYLGSLGDRVYDASVEAFAAIDDEVSYSPGLTDGSPWELPNNGTPSGNQRDVIIQPSRNFRDIRGGARFQFTTPFADDFDVTWSLAHYYTFHDLPNVQVCVHPGTGFGGFPFQRVTPRDPVIRSLGGQIPGCAINVNDFKFLLDLPTPANPNDPDLVPEPGQDWAILAPQAITVQMPAKIQISGATATFTVPARFSRLLGLSGEPVVRTELAYIKDEPYHTQGQLDPFIFHDLGKPADQQLATGGILKRDSVNFVLGIDTNQFIRFLNPRNSFFITTQFFYKHIKDAVESENPVDPNRAVLPVRARNVQNPNPALSGLGAVEPILVTQNQDQFLQTLLISTSYRSGTVNPSFTMLYDWSGARAYIPSVTFIHDPFRFTLQLNVLDAGELKGNSGVSLLRDRDNVLFQLEYVI